MQVPFHGEVLRLDQPIGHPLLESRPRPRILIGGTGEQHTLPLVARYADGRNLAKSRTLWRTGAAHSVT